MASAGGDCLAVVSADWLADALKSSNKKIRVLDITKGDHQSYLQSHISGAGYFEMLRDVPPTPHVPNALPSAEDFGKQVRSLGIDSDTHVVLYDRSEGKCGFFFGGRVWLMFKVFGHSMVSVLDGGMSKWTGSVDDVVPTFQEGNFKASFDQDFVWTFEVMQSRLLDGSFQLVDTRPPTLYNGGEADSGHIPGAQNIPFGKLIDTNTGLLKTKEELKQLLTDAGIDTNKMCVAYCNGGLSSCTFLLALYMLGVTTERHLYLGGFMEWSKRCSPEQIEEV